MIKNSFVISAKNFKTLPPVVPFSNSVKYFSSGRNSVLLVINGAKHKAYAAPQQSSQPQQQQQDQQQQQIEMTNDQLNELEMQKEMSQDREFFMKDTLYSNQVQPDGNLDDEPIYQGNWGIID